MHKLICVLCSDELVDFRRMIVGEGGRSQLGKIMYEKGPKQSLGLPDSATRLPKLELFDGRAVLAQRERHGRCPALATTSSAPV